MVATWDSLGAELGVGAVDEGAGAADKGAGAVLATWDSAGTAGGAIEPVFSGGATHRVQIVMVEVTFTVESSVTRLTMVLPPWLIVLETGQLVTVV